MFEEASAPEKAAERDTVLRNVLLGVAAIYIVVSLFLLFNLRSRVQGLEQKQQTLEASDKELRDKLHLTAKNMSDSVQALGSKVGMTQQEIENRTAELHRQQQQAEAKLTAEQRKTQQQVSQVSGDVTGVKTDLGGAKQDIASTRSDLDATRAKLEKAIGDLGIQSGLVARNHDELEMLKHKGDRNYFEFTLGKGQRKPVSTISLQLKKADPKRSKFTLNVIADDRMIEKKDRTANEPLQFYTGRDRSLYEIVVFKVERNSVSGYLSAPKTIQPKSE
jgi:small-conductance mechanosensitive channel